MKFINAAATFIYELIMLVSIFLFTFNFVDDTLLAIILGTIVDIFLVIIWALLLAPNAKKRLFIIMGLLLSSTLLALGPIILIMVYNNPFAIIVSSLFILNRILTIIWRQW